MKRVTTAYHIIHMDMPHRQPAADGFAAAAGIERVCRIQSTKPSVPISMNVSALKEPGMVQQMSFPGTFLQFGVFRGGTMRAIKHALYEGSHHSTVGFDSFQGLPAETGGLATRFVKGEYSAVAQSGATDADGKYWAGSSRRTTAVRSVQAAMEEVQRFIGERTTLVPGFYNVSLTAALAATIPKPVSYIDLDVDIYLSTFQALDWVLVHRLAKPGTVFGFDDFWATACSPSISISAAHNVQGHGQGLALKQIAEKYNACFVCICGLCSQHGPQVPGQGRAYFMLQSFSRTCSGLERASPAWLRSVADRCRATQGARQRARDDRQVLPLSHNAHTKLHLGR